MALGRRGAELLFQVLSEREEKNSAAIASNESLSGWTKTVTYPRLCAAIVETGTDSYRLAHTRDQLQHLGASSRHTLNQRQQGASAG